MGRKSKAAVRKREILEHFYNILKEEGLEKASIAKVAKRMAVNPSLLMHNFKTKEALTEAFVTHLLERYETNIKAVLSSPNYPKEQFETVLDNLFHEDWLHFSEPSVFYAFYYLSIRHETIRHQFQAFYLRLRTLLLSQVRYWIEVGIIHDQDPHQVVEYLIITNKGLLYYDQMMQDKVGFKNRAHYLKAAVRKVLL